MSTPFSLRISMNFHRDMPACWAAFQLVAWPFLYCSTACSMSFSWMPVPRSSRISVDLSLCSRFASLSSFSMVSRGSRRLMGSDNGFHCITLYIRCNIWVSLMAASLVLVITGYLLYEGNHRGSSAPLKVKPGSIAWCRL